MLSDVDPGCLFIVRRISKLGFKASRILKQHFSAYGAVVRVLVAHSTVRQPTEAARRRPSSLGFVQMLSAAAAQRVLAIGLEQEINGTSIKVQKFQHKDMKGACAEEADENVGDEGTGATVEWKRNISESTFTASTEAPSEECEM